MKPLEIVKDIIKTYDYKQWKMISNYIDLCFMREGFNKDSIDLGFMKGNKVERIIKSLSVTEWMQVKTTVSSLFTEQIEHISMANLDKRHTEEIFELSKPYFD